MFLTDNKAIIAFKHLLGKSNTDITKDVANENEGLFLSVNASDVWSSPINSNPAIAVTDGIAMAVTAELISDITSNGHSFFAVYSTPIAFGVGVLIINLKYVVTTLTAVHNGVTYAQGQAFIAVNADLTSGTVKKIVKGAIPPRYGYGYEAKPKASGIAISVGDARDWIYQYQSGIFFQQNNIGSTPTTIDLYYYIGETAGAVSLNMGNVLFVATTGNPTEIRTNIIGNISKPTTWENIPNIALSGDIIVVLPGVYTLTSTAANGYWVNGVTWNIMYGATINKTTSGVIWRRPATATVSADVIGEGIFNISGSCNGVYLNERDGIDCIFKYNIINSTSGYAYWSTSNNNDTIIGNYAKTTAGILINTYYGNTYINCATLISTTDHTIRRYIGTSTTIISNYIDNTSGGVAIDGGVFSIMGQRVNIQAGWVSRAQLSCGDIIYDVPYTTTLSLGCANGYVNGYVYSFGGGGANLKLGSVTYATISSGKVDLSVYNEEGTITINGSSSKTTVNITQDRAGVDYSNQIKTFNISGSRSVVNVIGTWASYGYNWAITDGRVNILGDYYTSPIDTSAAPFVLSANGSMCIKGTMIIGQTTPKEGMVKKTGGTLIIDGGKIIVNNQNQKAIIAPTTVQNVKVYPAGFGTNKTNVFGVEKQKIQFFPNTIGSPSQIRINGVLFVATTLTTLATIAQDLANQINASVNPSIQGVVVASQDTPGTDTYFYVEAVVAGVEFTVADQGYGGSYFIPYHTAGLTDLAGGITIIDADIID